MYILLGLWVKKYLNKKAKHHYTLLKYSLLKRFNSNFPMSILVPIIWESGTPRLLPAGWYSLNVRERCLEVLLIFRFFFHQNSLCSKTIARSKTEVDVEASLILT